MSSFFCQTGAKKFLALPFRPWLEPQEQGIPSTSPRHPTCSCSQWILSATSLRGNCSPLMVKQLYWRPIGNDYVPTYDLRGQGACDKRWLVFVILACMRYSDCILAHSGMQWGDRPGNPNWRVVPYTAGSIENMPPKPALLAGQLILCGTLGAMCNLYNTDEWWFVRFE